VAPGTPRRGRGRPPGSHVQRDLRRDELLDAAERSLRKGGPDLSLVDVAREAGLTRPAIYAAFPDKDSLVLALAQRQAHRIIAEIGVVVRSVGDPRGQTRAAVDCLCRWVDEEPSISAALTSRIRSTSVSEELARWLESVLTAGFRQLGADGAAAGPWARALVGAVSAAVFWWATDRAMSRAELVDHLTALIWSGFAGAGGAALTMPIETGPDDRPDRGYAG